MRKLKKLNLAKFYSNILKEDNFVIFVSNKGLNVEHTTVMRKKIYPNGGRLLFIKNSIFNVAIGSNNHVKSMLTGSLILCYGTNIVSLSKDLMSFSKIFSISLLGALYKEKIMDNIWLKRVANIPSESVLRYNIINLLRITQRKLLFSLKNPFFRVSMCIKKINLNNNLK